MRFSTRWSRTVSLLIMVVAACIPPLRPLAAQSTAAAKARIDSTRADLARYCRTNKPVGYLCSVDTLRLALASAALVAPAPAPTPIPAPTPTPAPVDSAKPPIALDVAPEAPRVTLDTRIANTAPTGRTLRVAPTGSLQAALDSANTGDRILLASGAIYRGNFVLPAKGACGSGGGWITVQSDVTTLPAEGTRMTPATATGLASIRTPNLFPALATAVCTARWRLIGLEITVDAGVTFNQGLVLLGDGSTAQTIAGSIARNLIFDRVYIHGSPALDMRRCVALNSDSTSIIDSAISDCHSAGFDAQAIAGWNGNGPYKITNNYLEASTEVVAFGGADPSIPNLVPSDIEIRRNHITRPMAWKGGSWLIKNLIEFKNARRAVIEGNVLENSWPNGQWGWAFVLWSVNQSGGCPWCITSDVLIQNNLIRNVAAGFQLTDKYGDTPSPKMTRVAIRNNVVIGLANQLVGNGGYGFLVSNTVPGLTIEHNTMFNPSSPSWIFPAGAAPVANSIRNNLTGGCGPYQISMQGAWAAIADTSSRFTGNVVACYDDYVHYLPSGNFMPMSLDAVGLAGGASAAYSVTATLDSLGLAPISPFKGKATDGKDVGADIAAVKAAIANVVRP